MQLFKIFATMFFLSTNITYADQQIDPLKKLWPAKIE